MKKPIDPNLDNFDNEELPIDIAAPEAENANPLKDGNAESPAESSKPAESSSPITADDFKMREKQYYHRLALSFPPFPPFAPLVALFPFREKEEKE